MLRKSDSFRLGIVNQKGAAYVEFALSLSLLLILLLGSIEVTRYVLVVQKLEKTASTMSDVITQSDANTDPLTASQLQQLMSAVPDMMMPYTFGSNGLVIVTDITQSGGNNPIINWRYCGGGTLTATSKLGSTLGGAATLPTGFSMIAGEEVVITEVFYSYKPITSTSWSVIGASTIYRTALFMPRLAGLGYASQTNC